LHLLLQAGLRVGETTSLCIGDVRLRSRGGEVHVRYGKGEKEREVPLNASVRRALSAYLETRHAAAPEPGEPLFLSRTGERLSERSVQALVQGLARRARISRLSVSPHTLRHTFALQYLKQNPGKLVELASLLGHDSLDTTAIYTRPSAEDLAADLEGSSLNVYG
jgi:integrase/recombinase XerC